MTPRSFFSDSAVAVLIDSSFSSRLYLECLDVCLKELKYGSD